MKKNKGLSPLLAAIILVAVTVAVSIAVAAWMGEITFTNKNTEPNENYIKYTFSGAPIIKYLGTQNLTLIQSGLRLVIPETIDDWESETLDMSFTPKYYVQTSDPAAYIQRLQEDNVKAVVSDYLTFEELTNPKPDTIYVMTNYHYWYYLDVENIGSVAVIFNGQATAFLPSE